MEPEQQVHWAKFHKDKQSLEHLHRIEGTVMLLLILTGPFVILWIMGMLLGQ